MGRAILSFGCNAGLRSETFTSAVRDSRVAAGIGTVLLTIPLPRRGSKIVGVIGVADRAA